MSRLLCRGPFNGALNIRCLLENWLRFLAFCCAFGFGVYEETNTKVWGSCISKFLRFGWRLHKLNRSGDANYSHRSSKTFGGVEADESFSFKDEWVKAAKRAWLVNFAFPFLLSDTSPEGLSKLFYNFSVALIRKGFKLFGSRTWLKYSLILESTQIAPWFSGEVSKYRLGPTFQTYIEAEYAFGEKEK